MGAAADGGKRPWGPEPGRCCGAGFLRTAKKRVTLSLDADVLACFQKQGRGYQTRINRGAMEVHDGREEEIAGIRLEPLYV